MLSPPGVTVDWGLCCSECDLVAGDAFVTRRDAMIGLACCSGPRVWQIRNVEILAEIEVAPLPSAPSPVVRVNGTRHVEDSAIFESVTFGRPRQRPGETESLIIMVPGGSRVCTGTPRSAAHWPERRRTGFTSLPKLTLPVARELGQLWTGIALILTLSFAILAATPPAAFQTRTSLGGLFSMDQTS